MSELCGYQGPKTFSKEYTYLSALYSGEGNQYQLFYELGISGLTANERLVRKVDGQPVYWWERTPSADSSEERTKGDGFVWSRSIGSNTKEVESTWLPTS